MMLIPGDIPPFGIECNFVQAAEGYPWIPITFISQLGQGYLMLAVQFATFN